MKDLSRLPPSEARKLLALAAMTIRAKAQRQPTMVPLQIPGSEVTDEAIRAGVHLLLVERRRAAGMLEPVDLAELIICDDERLRHHATYTDPPASRGADVTSVAGGPASRVHPG
jgi:hypothetical protein